MNLLIAYLSAVALASALLFIAGCRSPQGFNDPFVAESAEGRPLNKREADRYFGLGANRDRECMTISLDLLRDTLDNGGRAKVLYWVQDGQRHFHVLRKRPDGSFQGGTPATGYHSSALTTVFYGPGDHVPFNDLMDIIGPAKRGA